MKNRKNILTVTVIVLVCIVLLVLVAYFVTKGAGKDIEPAMTSTPEAIVTPIPKPTSTPEETIATTPELTYVTEESDVENEDESATESIIDGEISFNGVNMSQFFSEPIDALGPPLSIGEDNLELFYKDFSVVGDRYVDDPENVVYMLRIPDSNMVEINGISMNKQRDELLSLFGDPVGAQAEFENGAKLVTYTIKTSATEIYNVRFVFDKPDSGTVPRISISNALYWKNIN
jgi:hypothetical protein